MTQAPDDPLAALATLEGVPSALRSTRDAVDAVLTDRGLRQVSPDLRAAALLASARASAELEQEATGASEAPDLLPAVLRLYTELPALAGQLRRTPPQVLARAHVLLSRGQVPDERLGRYRPDPAVDARMRSLHELLTSRSSAAGMVLGAIAHAELAGTSPFGHGDQILARAVEHMILIDSGVDPLGVIVCEAGHARSATAYRSALRAYASGRSAGVRDWILHCTQAVARGAEVSPVNSRRSERDD